MKTKRSHFAFPCWLKAICFSLLVSIFLFTDRSMEVTYMEQMLEAMNGTQVNFLCAMLVCGLFYCKAPKAPGSRAALLSAIGALIFTLFDYFGYNIYHYDSLTRPAVTSFSLLLDMAWILGAFLLFFKLFGILFSFLACHSIGPKSGSRISRVLGPGKGSFFLTFFCLLGLSSVLLIFLYPGLTNFDSFYQLSQCFRVLPLNDAHPFLHTLQMKYVIQLGRLLFGTTARGIAFYTFYQSALVALAVSFLLQYMAKRNIHPLIRLLSFLYFLLHPAVACYSIFLWKDIWLAYFLMLYVLVLIDMLFFPQEFFRKKRHLVGAIFIILGFLFSKNTGILILALTLPFLFIVLRKYYKQLLVITCAVLSCFAFVRLVVIPASGMEANNISEPMSAPLQQIARTVAKAGDSLTEDQKAIIDEVLPFEELGNNYMPLISDPVKSTFRDEVFLQNPGRYISLWLELGTQHPRIYLESLLANSSGYWFPGLNYWVVEDTWYFTDYLSGDWFFYHLDPGDPDIAAYDLREQTLERGDWLRHYFVHLFILLQNAPIFSFLLSAAFPFWVAAVLTLSCIFKKKYRMLIPLLVPFCTFLICILSPVFAEYRYAFPAVVMVPVLTAFTLQDRFENPEN